jgi:hypothetical protein
MCRTERLCVGIQIEYILFWSDITFIVFQFFYRNIVLTIMMLLDRPEAENMSTTFVRETKKESGEEEHRAWGSFASGNFVKRTEALKGSRIPLNATILYMGLYIDSTLVGTFGKESRKPASMTLLNFNKEFITSSDSKKVCIHCFDVGFA